MSVPAAALVAVGKSEFSAACVLFIATLKFSSSLTAVQ